MCRLHFCTLIAHLRVGDEINLERAFVEDQSDGTRVYVCEATSFSPLQFSWETTIDGSRVPLPPNDPMALYSISTTVDPDTNPFFGISTIAYDPDEVNFPMPDCVIRNEAGEMERIRSSEFTVRDPTPSM